MLSKRIIPCLDVKNGKVVKGTNFKNLVEVGDPVELAIKYYKEGADELCFLDITASSENRKTMIEVVRNVAESIFIPFTVGGGIKTIEDINILLKNGADKVTFCTEAIKNPNIIKKASNKFGSQCIVISLDVKKNNDYWELFIYGGKQATGIDAIQFAKKCEELGAGEILLNSLDTDGTNQGYDIEITKLISEAINIPIIASSGAGNPEQILIAFREGKADAALAASIFHYEQYSISDVKNYLKSNSIEVRL
ncbi:imidazole glycerol phosphate synthase subunit HisF [archaeon]|jgi:cyclase|nr:imidazole glycerol phosphate synthase subunit HisF [archaeon]MBT4022338.1 imidazole glycerol phosphate synthase subunit HisF [archaeon]MBT4273216.1 imidazole glycerol phosphate synthase subunit HisF [archaeon]MBT4461341.1 imidazole glycerol phosphate synthase subunit HisF [archaeon]MBT4858915.1 imidazole glycerol phosphate synthase subunit HisF [archaeon]